MIVIAVPFRLESQRLRRKVLQKINGIPMCVHVMERCHRFFSQSKDIKFIAAVDHSETKTILEEHFPELYIQMTPARLKCGTDRIFYAYQKSLKNTPGFWRGVHSIVNLQGDMPFFEKASLAKVFRYLRENGKNKEAYVTLSQSWPDDLDYNSKDAVKVICKSNRDALYFSRFPVPESRRGDYKKRELHLGVYGYGLKSLEKFVKLRTSTFEHHEGLEQLRALEAGWNLKVIKVSPKDPLAFRGIDNQKDLKWARKKALS